MITWDNAQLISQTQAQDNSASGVAFLNMMLNVGYKEVLQTLQREVVEQRSTSVLKKDVRSYQVPPDCNTPKTLVLIDGLNRTEITEIPSDRAWEQRRYSTNSGNPTRYHFRSRFGVGGGVIELDPVPNKNTLQLELTYEATERDLSKPSYNTGTVSLTVNSALVVGTGTAFTQDMAGRYLRPTSDGAQRLPYRIQSVTDATNLILEQMYQFPNQAGVSFEIFEMFALPEDCQMLPIFYAEWQWWASKGNQKRAEMFEAQYISGLRTAKKRHANVTGDVVVELPSVADGFGSIVNDGSPIYFPTSIN